MATFSEIQITFEDDLELDNSFGFTASSPGPLLITNYVGYRMVSVRYQSGQIAVGTPTAIPGERTAASFVLAFQADWMGSSNLYAISRVENVVTIACTVETVVFSTGFSYNDYLEFPATLNSNVTFQYTDFDGVLFGIDSVTNIEAVDNPACTHFRVAVTTSVQADGWNFEGGGVTAVTENPFYFEVERGQGYNLHVFLDSGETDEYYVPYFQSVNNISSSQLQVSIATAPTGATITLSYLSSYSGGVEYSLDGDNWQTSNIFSGILDGDYTGYVRNLGCSVSVDFTVDNITSIVTPYFYISKSMSLRWAQVVEKDYQEIYDTEENTLSQDSYAIDPCMAKRDTSLFQVLDNITEQFLTNYENQQVNLIREDGSIVALNPLLYSNNIGRTDSRDAQKYSLGEGLTGIYFMTGSTYDYDSGADLGVDYALNGALPEYGIIGNWIYIDSAYYQIKNVLYDEDRNADILVIEEDYTGDEISVIVKAIYNRQVFEVYEFSLGFALYNNEELQVQLLLTDSRSNFPDLEFITEKIGVKTRHENTVEVKYYGLYNSDVYYTTGIQHLIRLPLISKELTHTDDSEILKGDSRSNLISSSVYEGILYELGLLTPGMYRKSVQALSHKYISIDGVGVIKDGGIDKEGPLEESNLYIVKAGMLKTTRPFTSNIVSLEEEIITENLEVPAAIIDHNGYPITY